MFHRTTVILIAASLSSAAGPAALAETVTVDQLGDFVDFAGSQTIADLPGPDGLVSFREAVIAVNNTLGQHTIEFAVPGDPENPLDTLLRIDGGAFVLTRDGTTIDFLSQAIFMGDPDPDGPGLGILNTTPTSIGQPALVIAASDCLVRGLGVTQFRESIRVVGGHDNRFVGNFTTSIVLRPNFGSTTTGNVIGGTDPQEGNVVDHISLVCGANDNVVVGNRVRSIDVTGNPFCGDGTERPTGNRIGGLTPAERNVVSGFGTYSDEGRPSGTGILVDFAMETIVEGNYVGVSEDGMAQAPDQNRGTTGIEVRDAINTTVRGNLVAGIRGIGISGFAGEVFGRAIRVNALNDDVIGVVIEGNLIGTDATGTQPILTHAGIEVIPGTNFRSIDDVRVGGSDPAAANVIAFTEGDGITIAEQDVSGVEVTRNRIHENDGLGIDLRAFSGSTGGVTANDSGDADTGPNSFQNFPVLHAVSFDGATATIAGELTSEPGRSYRVEIFASPMADSSGHGEGQVFLGEVNVPTDSGGAAAFDATFPVSSVEIADGWVATATATDIDRRETSEFGAAVVFELASPCPGDANASGTVGLDDLLLVLEAWGTQNEAMDWDGDGWVGLAELLAVLAGWGSCN